MKDAYDGDAGMVNLTVVALDIWCVRPSRHYRVNPLILRQMSLLYTLVNAP